MTTSKKIIILVITVVILGVAYWLISPLFIDKRVSELAPVISTSETSASSTPLVQVLGEGTFTGFDKIHHGSGSMKLLETPTGYIIRFEDDFVVGNGPDLYVGLGKDGKYAKGSEIARLKGNIGSQNYEVPDTIDIDDYNEVWIWCKAFSVPFAKAQFKS